MARLQLFFHQATEVVDSDNEGLIILTDPFQERQIAVPCDGAALEEFKKHADNVGAQSNQLIDVLLKVIRWQTNLDLEVVITGLNKGNYTAILSNVDTLDQVAISAPDAILLSYVGKNKIPLYIDETLFLKQSSPFDIRSEGVALPVNTLSMSMLRKALDKAISDENYELASQLRDEMERRKEKDQDKS
jgi:bifunctional DNase/RNase